MPTDRIFDIAFIGGGISNTFTWQSLLLQYPNLPLRVVMFDNDGNFGKGLPFGNRAAPGYLLNDTVSVLDENGVLGFHQWLIAEKPKWLSLVTKQTDPVLSLWVKKHQSAITVNNFYDLYMPRCVFGIFLQDRFERHLQVLEDYGHTFSLLQKKVHDVERLNNDLFAIHIETVEQPICARQIVLGIGALPSDFAAHLQGNLGYIHDVYAEGMEAIIAGALNVSDRLKKHKLRVGILGGGPTAAEMVYTWFSQPALRLHAGQLFVVTTSGKLPDGNYAALNASDYLVQLQRLQQEEDISAYDLIKAMRADIMHAGDRGMPILSIRKNTKETFNKIFSKLPVKEKKKFIIKYSERYISLMKCTAYDYSQVLQMQQKIENVIVYKAFVKSLQKINETFRLQIVDNSGFNQELEADIIINCLRIHNLKKIDSSVLLSKLLTRGLIKINETRRGIAVNEFFEASPNLFVIGPLLAGTCVDEHYIVHLYSVSGIYNLSRVIAKNIAAAAVG